MRISEMLQAIATWLESPNNEALLLAEDNEPCAEIVAHSCVLAAALLKNAAEEVDAIEPPEPSKLTPEAIEQVSRLAAVFDSSGDPELVKQASVLDELLLSIAAPPNAYAQRLTAEENKILDYKEKYENPVQTLENKEAIEQAKKDLEKSHILEYKPLEAALSSRYCPDHPGAPIYRIAEDTWQCSLDKKSYNFERGFTLYNGAKVPGTDVAEQSRVYQPPGYAVFDTRESRVNKT